MPRPFSLPSLLEQVSRLRGRPLYVHELPFAPGPDLPCGMWIATEQADHVYHATGVSALHRQNIVLHELGHLVCDHHPGEPDGIVALLPGLDPDMVRSVLLRTRYSSRQEREAEMIAALILEKAGWPSPRAASPAGPLDEVFGFPEGG
ncbi:MULTISPECIES: hypothetical protein [Amycolatopsis]|uniref:IrrE N-terminal-like domain-containing protein n=1 Tax=Amycolatopsis bullii TaxID=941987 RepID=A0ABQ3JX71_9PSEU|nr:hypothetical protein [Amycolatopsis bullii]GHF94146.1 hypothetical protein GCM10017567_05770 [Amycolatopsis bullii]